MAAQVWSAPVSQLLREGTIKAHQEVEHSQGAAWLARGQLDRIEYARFLMMLHQVYSALEDGLNTYATNPVLKPTYQPSLLSRAASLSEDIGYLLGTADWHTNHVSLELQSATPEALTNYVSRIRALSASEDSARLLLAHAYVRYLGDLSGGQVIKRRLAKAYDLPETGEGVRFYEFDSSSGDGSKAATDEMKRVKEWYRNGMDTGVGDDEKLKAAIVDEAVLVFHLNQALFDAIRGPSQEPLSPLTEAPPSPSTLVPSGIAASLPPVLSSKLSPSPAPETTPPSFSVRLGVMIAIGIGYAIWQFSSLEHVPQPAIDAWGWAVDRVTAELR